jgi:hypothetical protein
LRGFRARGFPVLPSVPLSLLDGKEGVDGSSPSEGSAKAPEIGTFVFGLTCTISSVRRVWSRLEDPQPRSGIEDVRRVRRVIFRLAACACWRRTAGKASSPDPYADRGSHGEWTCELPSDSIRGVPGQPASRAQRGSPLQALLRPRVTKADNNRWSPWGAQRAQPLATARNQRQIDRPSKPQEQAKSVCHRLPPVAARSTW